MIISYAQLEIDYKVSSFYRESLMNSKFFETIGQIYPIASNGVIVPVIRS